MERVIRELGLEACANTKVCNDQYSWAWLMGVAYSNGVRVCIGAWTNRWLQRDVVVYRGVGGMTPACIGTWTNKVAAI